MYADQMRDLLRRICTKEGQHNEQTHRQKSQLSQAHPRALATGLQGRWPLAGTRVAMTYSPKRRRTGGSGDSAGQPSVFGKRVVGQTLTKKAIALLPMWTTARSRDGPLCPLPWPSTLCLRHELVCPLFLFWAREGIMCQ
jgi:hypothetical protein